jgi:hypothetical protein
MKLNAFCLGTASSSFFFAVPAFLLLLADDLLAGNANGTVVELDLALETGRVIDGRGRRLLLVDATIPGRGSVGRSEVSTYIKRVRRSFELGQIEKRLTSIEEGTLHPVLPMLRSSTSMLSLAGKGVSGRGVKGDIGMSLFKDSFPSGVEGISEEVIRIVDVGDVSRSVSFIDAVWISSVIFGKGSTSVAFKVLPDSSTTSMAESGIVPNLANGVDVMRNLSSRSFEGEREHERERFEDGGGFLRSMRGMSLNDAKRGTDWALPFSAGITREDVDEVGLTPTVETGFLVVVAERFLVERLPARTSESERLRACPTTERWRRMSANLRLTLELSLSSSSKSRFTLLGFLLSDGDPERGECSSSGGDADRLEWLVCI